MAAAAMKPSAFPYTNPYTQPSSPKHDDPNLEQALGRLLQYSSNTTTTTTLDRLEQLLLDTQQQWTYDGASRLVGWIVQRVLTKTDEHNSNNNSHAIETRALSMLDRAMSCWPDTLLYAVVTEDNDDDQSLLQVLHTIVRQPPTNPVRQQAAMLCVATVWTALDRLHWLSCTNPKQMSDPVWWIDDDDDDDDWQQHVMNMALHVWINDDSMEMEEARTAAVVVRPEDLGTAAAQILLQLLQHSSHSSADCWLYGIEDVTLQRLLLRLVQQVERLHDLNMPYTSYTKLSLASLALLEAFQWKGIDLSRHSNLMAQNMEHIVASHWNNNTTTSSTMPRWAQSANDPSLSNATLSILRVAQHGPPPITVPTHVLEEAWDAILSKGNADDGCLTRLFLWHTENRFPTRQALGSVLHRNGPHQQQLLVSLLETIHQSDSVVAAALLRSLLEDRRQLATHDEVSRSLWQTIDQRFVQQCLDVTLSLSSVDMKRPQLLIMLDIMYILLSCDDERCQEIVQSLPAQSMERLVMIMTPKQVRMDLADTQTVMESEQSTPPANNLSRLEEKSICIEEEEDARGMDPAVRMAAATVLAVLGSCPTTMTLEGRVSLLQGRMCDVVHSFMAETKLSYCMPDGESQSLDTTRRRLRLWNALGSADNEEYLSGLLHSAERSQHKVLVDLKRDAYRYKQSLAESRKKEQQLIAEKEVYARKLTFQSVGFQREKHQLQKAISQDAKQMIQVHNTERSKAEQRLQEMSQKLQAAENRVGEAEWTVRKSRESEAEARSALETMTTRVKELETREQEISQHARHSKSELQRVSEELQSTKCSLDDMVRHESEMRGRMKMQEETLADMEDSQGTMRESLESLFGDMVSLAQLYEIKEGEVSEARENSEALVQKLKRKLEAEQKRNDELEDKQRQIQYENEYLSKKYAKAREKLENERQERREEAERRKRVGPVSYINQLHQSTASEKTLARDRSRREKENDSHYSSSSRRSKSYR